MAWPRSGPDIKESLGFEEISRFEPEGRLAWASLARGAVKRMLTRAEPSQALPAGGPARGAVQF